MSDEPEGDFYSAEKLEAMVNERLFSMVALCADPAGAARRLKEIKQATAELVTQQSVSEKVVEQAEAKSARLAKDEASLAKRTADFQSWVDTTEKNYRDREFRVRDNEEAQAKRDRVLIEQETDLSKRTAAHDQRVASLRANLG